MSQVEPVAQKYKQTGCDAGGGEGRRRGDVMKIVGFWKKRVVLLSARNDLSSTVNRSVPSFD